MRRISDNGVRSAIRISNLQTNMFEQISPAPPDAILGLTDAFKTDLNPQKVNLGVGVYKNAAGATPILTSVKKAEEILLSSETTKSYLPITGSPGYAKGVQRLLFGDDHELLGSGRAATAHTPGGTGALRVGGEFLKRFRPDAKIWMSNPTWANHKGVFSSAGLALAEYPYYDAQTRCLDFDAMLATLKSVPAGDIVLLHVTCHNPTGVDPSPEQWEILAETAAVAGWFPFFDFAYQGFGVSVDADRAPLEMFAAKGLEFVVASSCSKNFGLYNERTGGFTLVGKDADSVAAAFSHVKSTIRTNYSNPSNHGGAIVETILSSSELTTEWLLELDGMRDRIKAMRSALAGGLKQRGAELDFGFIERQNGMFSFSGLSEAAVNQLRNEHAIYIVKDGRINVAGITPDNTDYLCDAIAKVL